MKPIIWTSCYESSWNGFITPESFAHPAKYARGLIERILDYALAKGYLRKGDICGDAFGGIGTGGIIAAYRGLAWVGVELEPKFVSFANQNFDLHRSKWDRLGVPHPVIIQGDSRRFAELVSCSGVVASPPYADTPIVGPNTGPCAGGIGLQYRLGNRPTNASHDCQTGYGESSGQIGSLKAGDVAGVISSKAVVDRTKSRLHNNSHGITKCSADDSRLRERTQPGTHCGKISNTSDYSAAKIQTGGVQIQKPSGFCQNRDSGETKDGSDNSRKKPLPLEGGNFETPISQVGKERILRTVREGREPGDSSSQPESLRQRSEESTGTLRIVSHEPSQESLLESEARGKANAEIERQDRVDSVISSPPWEKNCEGGVRKSKFNYVLADTKGHGSTPAAKQRAMERDEQKTYGDSPGQIGQEKAETYWSAVKTVYEQCFQAIRPGGVIILVVKDYISKGKRVRLCDDTMTLLEHIGFQPLERIHAMLTSETVEAGLFGEHRTTKQRKSFFRRLYEQKLPEGDERRIDHEEILIARKP